MNEAAKSVRYEYMKEYRRKNKERINELKREWARKNPDKVKEYQDRHWERHAALRGGERA